MEAVKCHCGLPLHYTDPDLQESIQNIIAEQGEFMPVMVKGRTWKVQRHYIALHGIIAAEIEHLGFEEIT